MNPGRRTGNQTTGTMLRLLGAARKREVKATQNLSRIVIFFIICWFPLYTINCVMAFCPNCEVNAVLMNFCIILSHLNSVGNPLLYAYHLKDFRAALKNFMWRLLFPHSDVKSSVVSVIQDRGSLAGSHRQLQRHGGNNLVTRGQRPSLLRQVTESQARCVPAPFSRNASCHQVEERNTTPLSSSQSEHRRIASEDASPNSPNDRHEVRQSADSPSINNRSESSQSDPASPSQMSCMELQIYRPLLPLLRAEVDRPEETPPTSIFVIEVDVNRSACTRDKVTLEEDTECRKEKDVVD